MSRILVLDDDPAIRRTLEILLAGDGHEVLTASTGEEALQRVEREPVDLAFVDLQLPGIDGLEVLRHLRDRRREVEVVIITAFGAVDSAVSAMKEGAFDYLTKPFSPAQVRHRVRQVERLHSLEDQVRGLSRRVGEAEEGTFLTRSPELLHLIELVRSVAETDVTVLLAGESGTGKSLLARRLHQASPRRDGPFVTLDCTSFQESLLESELFGHRRGAFTGAVADKAGKVEAAGGGTLFLDEVGEIPLSLQGKLLRLVEERAYERVGDPTPRSLDARIVAATNRDLEELVRDKAFRQDLFYRLSVVDLTLPPLRQRPGDLLFLAEEFMQRASTRHERRVTGWDADFERLVVRWPWPGNVRELAHVMERAVLLAPGRILRPEHLPERLREGPAPSEPGGARTLAETEEATIRRALAQGLPMGETAKLLGIDPSTLWRKRKRYGI